MKSPSKIYLQIANTEQRTIPDRWKCILGAFSAPKVGSRLLRARKGAEHDLPKIGFGAPENRTSVQHRAFEHRLALRPSKNGLWKGVRKKHEIPMKKRCENL